MAEKKPTDSSVTAHEKPTDGTEPILALETADEVRPGVKPPRRKPAAESTGTDTPGVAVEVDNDPEAEALSHAKYQPSEPLRLADGTWLPETEGREGGDTRSPEAYAELGTEEEMRAASARVIAEQREALLESRRRTAAAVSAATRKPGSSETRPEKPAFDPSHYPAAKMVFDTLDALRQKDCKVVWQLEYESANGRNVPYILIAVARKENAPIAQDQLRGEMSELVRRVGASEVLNHMALKQGDSELSSPLVENRGVFKFAVHNRPKVKSEILELRKMLAASKMHEVPPETEGTYKLTPRAPSLPAPTVE